MKYTYSAKKTEEILLPGAVAVSVRRQKKTETIVEDGKRTIVIGVGPEEKINRRKFIILVRNIIALAKADESRTIMFDVNELLSFADGVSEESAAEIVGTNLEMANYAFNELKTEPKDGWKDVKEVIFTGPTSTKVRPHVERGKVIGEEVNKTRTLANMPGGMMTPSILAAKAKELAKNTKVKVQVLGEAEMKKLKMGGVLGVAQGSKEKPQFIVMEYKGGPASERPLVLVGKAVTFDTGGLNLKSSEGILEMYLDMSGGAAVLQTIALASRLGVKRNVVGLIPAVENSPGGESYRPGDVLKTMSGKTIEVLNTDAEGRIILADALTYAKKYKPLAVVDVATLTGAAVVALGVECSAIFTEDDALAEQTRKLAEESGDYVWRMPLWEEYKEYIKGVRGDVANVGSKSAGGAGAITAAKFLQEFTDGYTWMHIDMAPRMVATENEKLERVQPVLRCDSFSNL